MAEKFEKVIENFVNKSKEEMLNVVKDSIKITVQDTQKTVHDGGKMRVDTGFLRSSGLAGLNQIPSGQSEGRKREPGEVGVLSEYSKHEVEDYLIPVLAKMKIGDVFYFGWTARYARIRELYDGFLDSAVIKWSQTVDNVVRGLKK